MTEEKFLEQLTDLMDTETELTMATDLQDIEEWDSLSFVSFIAFANAEAGKKLTADQIRGAETVGDLYRLLQD